MYTKICAMFDKLSFVILKQKTIYDDNTVTIQYKKFDKISDAILFFENNDFVFFFFLL